MTYSFLLASGNVHKAEELSQLFDPKVITLSSAPESLEPEENGTSFQQNALIKAESYYQKHKVPVLADDSGLNVSALPDELGVHSARFGGSGLSDEERALLLLEKLEDKNGIDRHACFVCILCFYLSKDEVFFFEGRTEGKISQTYKGQHGFGYDPVFAPRLPLLSEEKTLAQLSFWKKKYGHRAWAARFAEHFFRSRLTQK